MTSFSLVTKIRFAIGVVLALVATVAAMSLWPEKGVGYAAMVSDASGVVERNDVRLNDVIVGHVTSIDLEGLHARVNFELADDVQVPAETRVEIRQTSLLGEYFLALVPDGDGQLAPGSVVPLERTRRAAELETIVSQAGDLTAQVNIDNIDRILASLDEGLGDDPAAVGDLFESMAQTASSLSGLREDLVETIDSVDALTARLAPETGRLTTAIDRFADGAEALAATNDQIPTLVSELNRATASLSDTLSRNRDRLVGATPIVRDTLQEAVDNLDGLASVLTGLPGFNRGWACAADGNYLNFIFPLTPEFATVDVNPERCDNIEDGPAGRSRPTQVHLFPGLDGLTIDDPAGTGDVDLGAGTANDGQAEREEQRNP